jgi:hypothetical protein
MHGQLGVLNETFLDVVGAGNNPQQAWISRRLVVGIFDQHSHFAADASSESRSSLWSCIVGSIDCPASNAARRCREIIADAKFV